MQTEVSIFQKLVSQLQLQTSAIETEEQRSGWSQDWTGQESAVYTARKERQLFLLGSILWTTS
jgi:hypothetical protein